MGDGVVMRVHRVRAEFVVAACDEELVGRDLPIGSSGRTVKISSQFYGERAVTREEIVWALKRATVVNLLGPRAVAIGVDEGFVGPDGTGTLGGVPHAEVFTIPES